MTAAPPSLAAVCEQLEREQRLAPGWRARLDAQLGRAGSMSPWFVRAMVGFGAWLAALLLIGSIVGITDIAGTGGFFVLGFVFMGGALGCRYRYDGDFARQLTLAVSLAGQGLFALAVVETIGFDLQVEALLVALAVINAVALIAFPDDTHRFLSTVIVIGCLCGLLYALQLQAVVPVVAPALAALLLVLFRRESEFAAGGRLLALSAVRAGVLIGALGSVLPSTVYVLPELADDFAFFPRPWLATLLLGGLLLWLEREFVATIFAAATAKQSAVTYALTALVVLAALPAPGLILALLVVVIGAIRGSAFYRGTGIAFLAVFTTTYFYGIDVGMLAKSASLLVTGLVVLACRWLFLRATAGPVAESVAAGSETDA